MPIEVAEKYAARRLTTGDRGSAQLEYLVWGTGGTAVDADDAEAEVASFAPATFQGLRRSSITVEEETNDRWVARVRYDALSGSFSGAEVGDSTITFSTGGQTQRITNSIQTVSRHAPAGETPPNFGTAINVRDGDVEGVEITVPQYRFSETHIIAAATVTQAYRLVLAQLTGKVNNATFRGFLSHEVLFLGAEGTRRGLEVTDPWEITFNFVREPTVTGLDIGGVSVPVKRGWDYLWVVHKDVVDSSSEKLVKAVDSVHVEEVYEPANFGLLGI